MIPVTVVALLLSIPLFLGAQTYVDSERYWLQLYKVTLQR
jgi:hypothetical protein